MFLSTECRKKVSAEEKPPSLKRTASPKLRDLHQQSWRIGRGKGGKKLSAGGGLAKNASERGFWKMFRVHKCAVGLVKKDVKK